MQPAGHTNNNKGFHGSQEDFNNQVVVSDLIRADLVCHLPSAGSQAKEKKAANGVLAQFNRFRYIFTV